MEDFCTDDLCDPTDWIAASLELQRTEDDAQVSEVFNRIAFLQARTASREGTPFQTLAQRLSLTDTEQHVVMLLVSMRTRSDVQTTVRQIAMKSATFACTAFCERRTMGSTGARRTCIREQRL